MRALFGILQAILGLAIIALAWAGAAAILQDSNKLPSLAATLNRAFQLATSDDYRQHINASTSVLLTGLLPAVAAGIVLGIVAGISTVFRWLLGPLFITLAAAPLIALMPLLLLWLGLGPTLTVVAVAIITVFPVANAVMMALAMQQGSVALAIVRGLRWGAVFGATALVICEMLTSRVGVGTYIMNAGATFNVPNAAAGIVLVFVPIIVVVALLQAIEEQLAA
jgi:ABC-type nitrate/sulfonate/bicarbonate transport system permease component